MKTAYILQHSFGREWQSVRQANRSVKAAKDLARKTFRSLSEECRFTGGSSLALRVIDLMTKDVKASGTIVGDQLVWSE